LGCLEKFTNILKTSELLSTNPLGSLDYHFKAFHLVYTFTVVFMLSHKKIFMPDTLVINASSEKSYRYLLVSCTCFVSINPVIQHSPRFTDWLQICCSSKYDDLTRVVYSYTHSNNSSIRNEFYYCKITLEQTFSIAIGKHLFCRSFENPIFKILFDIKKIVSCFEFKISCHSEYNRIILFNYLGF